VALANILLCFSGALYAQPAGNNFNIPQNGAWTEFQQLAGNYDIWAKVQCQFQTGMVIVEFEYRGNPGNGYFICFTVTTSNGESFTTHVMTRLPAWYLVNVPTVSALCRFSNLPTIAIALDRVTPYIYGGHPPMLRPCKPRRVKAHT